MVFMLSQVARRCLRPCILTRRVVACAGVGPLQRYPGHHRNFAYSSALKFGIGFVLLASEQSPDGPVLCGTGKELNGATTPSVPIMKDQKAIKAKAEACFTIDQMPKKKSENQRYSFKCKFCPGFQKVLEACSVRSNTSCGAIFMARQ